MPNEKEDLQHIGTEFSQTGDKQVPSQAIEVRRSNQAQPLWRVLGVKDKDMSKDIFNVYFKVKISSNEEREKVVNHLREVGFYYPNDDTDKNEVIGLLVGNAYIGEMLFPVSLDNCPHQEYTVEEVLNMSFE